MSNYEVVVFFLDCFGLILTLTRYNAYLPTFPFNLEKWQHWVCDSNSLLTFLHIFLLAYLLCGQKSTEKIVKVQLLYTAWKHNTIFLLKNAYLSSTKTMLLCWSHDSINNKLKKYLVKYVFFVKTQNSTPKITKDLYGVFQSNMWIVIFFIFFVWITNPRMINDIFPHLINVYFSLNFWLFLIVL